MTRTAFPKNTAFREANLHYLTYWNLSIQSEMSKNKVHVNGTNYGQDTIVLYTQHILFSFLSFPHKQMNTFFFSLFSLCFLFSSHASSLYSEKVLFSISSVQTFHSSFCTYHTKKKKNKRSIMRIYLNLVWRQSTHCSWLSKWHLHTDWMIVVEDERSGGKIVTVYERLI